MKGQKKAAKEQAAAIRESAAAQAKQARLQAQAAQAQQEQMINRQRAVDAAKALAENQDKQTVDVNTTVTDPTGQEVDPLTGRRRNPREAYRSNDSASGLKI